MKNERDSFYGTAILKPQKKQDRKILEQGGHRDRKPWLAAAATLRWCNPHMNGLGGERFLVDQRNRAKHPVAVLMLWQGCRLRHWVFYCGHDSIPTRGGKAALTMAGAVQAGKKALAVSQEWQARLPTAQNLPLSTLLDDAIQLAKNRAAAVTKPTSYASKEKTLLIWFMFQGLTRRF